MRRLTLAAACLLALAGCAADPNGTVPRDADTATSPGGATMTPSTSSADPGATGDPSRTPPPPLDPPSTFGPPAGEVTVTGIVEAGVEAGCLLLDGWLLINGDPAVIQAGRRVRVTGRAATDIASYCQQGTPLIVSSAQPA